MPQIEFQFWEGGGRHLPESPDFQHLVNFLEGGCIFSQLDHLSKLSSDWVTGALYMPSAVGFIVVTTTSTGFFFEHGEG